MENKLPALLIIIQWFMRVSGFLLIAIGLFIPIISLIWEVESKFIIRAVGLALIPISLGILHFFAARGLGKLKNWGKNITIILSILNIFVIIGLFIFRKEFLGNLIYLVIFIGIIYYLLKNKNPNV